MWNRIGYMVILSHLDRISNVDLLLSPVVHSARNQTVCSLCSKKKKYFLAHVSVLINEKNFMSIGHRLRTRQVELGMDSQRAPLCTGYSKST